MMQFEASTSGSGHPFSNCNEIHMLWTNIWNQNHAKKVEDSPVSD